MNCSQDSIPFSEKNVFFVIVKQLEHCVRYILLLKNVYDSHHQNAFYTCP